MSIQYACNYEPAPLLGVLHDLLYIESSQPPGEVHTITITLEVKMEWRQSQWFGSALTPETVPSAPLPAFHRAHTTVELLFHGAWVPHNMQVSFCP